VSLSRAAVGLHSVAPTAERKELAGFGRENHCWGQRRDILVKRQPMRAEGQANKNMLITSWEA
jgi:hypothetical protein